MAAKTIEDMSSIDFDDIQGIVSRGYGNLGESEFLLLRFGDPERARSWLAELKGRVTPAATRPEREALNVALTLRGMASLGLGAESLDGFSEDFRSGMVTEHKSRTLGDHGASAPELWRWGGPKTPPLDALVLLYADTSDTLDTAIAREKEKAESASIEILNTLNGSPLPHGKEHFGFRDGISQPFIQELKPNLVHPHPIELGEFVLGHANAYGRYTQRALVPPAADSKDILSPAAEDENQRDFCLNGSYLVLRQMEQKVSNFWEFVSSAAETQAHGMDRIQLAAKMVGRWPSGAPLVVSPEQDDPSAGLQNEFAYHDADADGLKCPFGAHIRRTNPRDSLEPQPGTDRSIESSNRHRILRRGRSYGPPLAEAMDLSIDSMPKDDSIERGLLFMCLNGNLRRQFEFVQHTWSNNPNFDGQYSETDPITGDRHAQSRDTTDFTIPAEPVRMCIHNLPDFVTIRGGSYFFLPSIRALEYLASL